MPTGRPAITADLSHPPGEERSRDQASGDRGRPGSSPARVGGGLVEPGRVVVAGVGVFWEVLADEAVGVLVGASRPGRCGSQRRRPHRCRCRARRIGPPRPSRGHRDTTVGSLSRSDTPLHACNTKTSEGGDGASGIRGSEVVEEPPVGFAGVEQRSERWLVKLRIRRRARLTRDRLLTASVGLFELPRVWGRLAGVGVGVVEESPVVEPVNPFQGSGRRGLAGASVGDGFGLAEPDDRSGRRCCGDRRRSRRCRWREAFVGADRKVLSGFNRWSQHRSVGWSVGVRRGFRRECAGRGSCAVGC